MNQYHEVNRAKWNANAQHWKELKVTMNWHLCHKDPSIRFCETELDALGDMAGKNACVFASGDNRAVFALAGMGATVTSVDISENQLQVAAERAEELNLDIRFIRSDVAHIPELKDDQFDLVFMGSGAICWFSDLSAVCQEAARVLVSGGKLIIRDSHPFRSVWKKNAPQFELVRSYYDNGPHEVVTSNVLPHGAHSYQFSWTVSDQLQAVLAAGCEIVDVVEWGEEGGEGDAMPEKGLPTALFIHSRKR